MNITIVGTGYVGLVTGVCFSEMENEVYSVDIDEKKIECLKKGIMPIYEHELEGMVAKNYEKGNIIFTTSLEEGLNNSEICFIAAGTPMDEDGSADLSAIFQIAKNIGQLMINDLIVVNKSTVPVGTGDNVRDIISKELESRGVSFNFDVVSNPEFLKEGAAVKDAMRPDRVVIGSSNENSIKILKELYSPYVRNHDRFIVMDIRSAELSKYASNAMLATRISFMNEIANICERVGADINNVRLGVGSDPRIGYSFLYAGCGYGGSCFPKDIQALIKTAEDNNYSPKILKEVEKVNKKQKMVLVNKIINRFGEDLTGLKIGLWGLSFKPGTDDMREAPSIVIINELLKMGATIKVYDPKAVEEAREIFGDKIEFCNKKYDVLNDANCLVIVTEWNEFKSPNFKSLKDRMKEKVIFDGRNLYTCNLEDNGFEYYSIG